MSTSVTPIRCEFEERIYVKTRGHEPAAPRPQAGARQRPGNGDRSGDGSISAGGGEVRGHPARARGDGAGARPARRDHHQVRRVIVRDIDAASRAGGGSDLRVNVSLISLDRDLLRLVEPRAPRPDLRLPRHASRRRSRAYGRASSSCRCCPLITDGEAALRALLLAAARGRGRGGDLRKPCSSVRRRARDFFLDFVQRASFRGRCRGTRSYFRGPARRRARVARRRSSGWSRQLARRGGLHGTKPRGARARRGTGAPPTALARLVAAT